MIDGAVELGDTLIPDLLDMTVDAYDVPYGLGAKLLISLDPASLWLPPDPRGLLQLDSPLAESVARCNAGGGDN